MTRFSLKKLLGRGGKAAPTIPSDLNITIRRQHRRSLMMRPIPGGFEVYIPRWMRPDNPTVTTFIAKSLDKFGNQAPPIPPTLTTREEITAMVNHWAAQMGLQPKRISFRDMTRKWGSCSSRDNITLSTRLTWVEPHLAEYVVVHELVHLRVFNHGKDFKDMMSQYMPDWKTREQTLHAIRF
ncbi:MAG: M48 family metallopeptidase [Chloroflexi bacterium]|nr:M48 family metallopeptidase [Chloroflexota bacterium]